MRMKRIHEIILGGRKVMSKIFQEGKTCLISVREKRESSSLYDFNIMSNHTKKSTKIYI